MDLSKLSDQDLLALRAPQAAGGVDLSKLSDACGARSASKSWSESFDRSITSTRDA